MQTSDVKGASTNARVQLQIFGVASGKPLKLPLQQEGFPLDNSNDNFERGKYVSSDAPLSLYHHCL